MTNYVVIVPADVTISAARKLMYERLQTPDFVYFLYVVDDEQKCTLLGVVTLRDFVIAEDDRRIGDIMQLNVVTIDPLEPSLDAARRVADHGLAALTSRWARWAPTWRGNA